MLFEKAPDEQKKVPLGEAGLGTSCPARRVIAALPQTRAWHHMLSTEARANEQRKRNAAFL